MCRPDTGRPSCRNPSRGQSYSFQFSVLKGRESGLVRQLRIQYPGAFYHVTSRGNERQTIFKSRRDHEKFLEYLESATTRYAARIHAYCLMTNHYHLLLETPEGNLARIITRPVRGPRPCGRICDACDSALLRNHAAHQWGVHDVLQREGNGVASTEFRFQDFKFGVGRRVVEDRGG